MRFSPIIPVLLSSNGSICTRSLEINLWSSFIDQVFRPMTEMHFCFASRNSGLMGFPRCVTLLGLFLWLPGGKVYGDGADMSVGNCQRRTVTVSVPAAAIRQNAARRPDPESDKTPLGEALSISLRSDFPGELAIVDDLRSTDLPYFVIEVSGPSEEVGRVGWRQAWLANGTFYFHMRDRAAPDDDSLHLAPPAFWPTEHPTTPPGQSQNYVLRVSVMVRNANTSFNVQQTFVLPSYISCAAYGCIILWGHGCATNAVPSITSTLVLISLTSEG
uniref:Astrotactin-1/2 N-terminal domain-containing protein n=1 Tax=Eptatretus burgeri TaxID=7764 RepID=A0A8C4QRA7_EPTBU